MRGITISFPGVLALDNVDFFLRPGEVHSIMGENGAGKSTLIKALTGVYAIDSGSIDVTGTSQVFRSTFDAEAAGISTVYQEINLCTNLSVGENVMLGHEPRKRGRIDWKAVHRLAAEHLDGLGISIDTRSLLSNHSIAIQQLVAISRAMVLDAKVFVLDEPTSSLDRGEVEQLFTVIRDLRARGAAIIFVSHFLDQVYEIADRDHGSSQRQTRGRVPRQGPATGRAGDQDDRSPARRPRGHLLDRGACDRPHGCADPQGDRRGQARRTRACGPRRVQR